MLSTNNEMATTYSEIVGVEVTFCSEDAQFESRAATRAILRLFVVFSLLRSFQIISNSSYHSALYWQRRNINHKKVTYDISPTLQSFASLVHQFYFKNTPKSTRVTNFVMKLSFRTGTLHFYHGRQQFKIPSILSITGPTVTKVTLKISGGAGVKYSLKKEQCHGRINSSCKKLKPQRWGFWGGWQATQETIK
jgi:hypothetical protein